MEDEHTITIFTNEGNITLTGRITDINQVMKYPTKTITDEDGNKLIKIDWDSPYYEVELTFEGVEKYHIQKIDWGRDE